MKFERRNNRNKLLKHPEMVVQDSLTVNWDVESFLQTTDDDLFQKTASSARWKIAEDVVCYILGDSSII